MSLKLALERLLDGPCYHMTEQMNRREDAPIWWAGLKGEQIKWADFLDGWSATVDWPGCSLWRQLATAFPEAKVLLSIREPRSWWESANRTIFPAARSIDEENPFRKYLLDLFHHVGVDMDDRDGSIEAFSTHIESVRSAIEPDRLIEWSPGDGWKPLCEGLGVPEPDAAFPHANTSSGFEEMLDRARIGDVPRNAEPPPPYTK